MRKYFFIIFLFLIVSKLYSTDINTLYVVDARSLSLSDKLTLVSLQGIVNRESKNSGLMVILREEDIKWLHDIENRRNLEVIKLSEKEVLEKYKNDIKGVIVYDENKPYTINIATTLAGIKNGIISSKDIAGIPTIFDCRNKWKSKISAYEWAIKNLLHKTTTEMAAILEEHITSLRDFIIQNKVFVFDLDPINNKEEIKLIEKILSYYKPNTPIIGWPDAKYADPERGQTDVSVEVAFVELISPRNIFLVASDFACNLSIYKKLSSQIPFIQLRKKEIFDPNKVYITFVYSDGDNIQYVLNHMRADLWDDKDRLKLPIGWTIAPLLYKWGGFILEKYYSDAYFSENDEFVMGPSGFGYVHPTKYKDIDTFLKFTEKYVDVLDLKSVAVLDEGSLQDMLDTYKKFANQTSLETIFFGGNLGYNGLLKTDKSAIWVLSEDFRANFVENNVNEIKRLISSGRKMIYSYAHAWDIKPSQLYEIIKKVSKLNVKVVLPSTFSDLLYQRLVRKYNKNVKSNNDSIFEVKKRVIYPITYKWKKYKKINLLNFNLKMDSSRVLSAEIVYWFDNDVKNKYFEYLRYKGNNKYTVTLPPIYKGKKLNYYVSVVTKDFSIEKTLIKSVKVSFYSDRDKDGLSDDFEINISKTSPDNKDTDGDGIYDGIDNEPLKKLKNEKVIYTITPQEEAKFLWKDHKSLKATDGHRYADNDAYFIYKLPIYKNVIKPRLSLLLDNNYVVEISKDGKNFKKVLFSSYDCHDSGNKGWKIINLSPDYLKEDYIYVKISDGSPQDGWGGGCYGIKLLGEWGDVKILNVLYPDEFQKNKKNKIVIYEANKYPLKDIIIKINNKRIKKFNYNKNKEYIEFYFNPEKEGEYNLNIILKDINNNSDEKNISIKVKFKDNLNSEKKVLIFDKVKIQSKEWTIFAGWDEGECGKSEELHYIFKNNNSAVDGMKHRFTDGNNYVIYKFYSPLNIGVLKIKIGNDYIVSISTNTNNMTWYKLLDSYELYGKDIHNLSNYEEHILNISSYIKENKNFYIKIEDKTKNDGWGGNIGYIKFGIPPVYKYKERVVIGVSFKYNDVKSYIEKGRLIKHIIYPKEVNPLFAENFDDNFDKLFVFSIPSTVLEGIYKIDIIAQYKKAEQKKELYIGVYNKKLKYKTHKIKKVIHETNKTIFDKLKEYFKDFGKINNNNSLVVSKEFVENNNLSCYFPGWGTGHCGTESETKYLFYKNSGSINPAGMRFADGKAIFGYKFKLPRRWRRVVLEVDIGNNFIIEVYNSKLNKWVEVLNSQKMYGEDIHNMSNYKAYYLNLTNFINHKENMIKIRFRDGSTNDGWGPCLGDIKIFIK